MLRFHHEYEHEMTMRYHPTLGVSYEVNNEDVAPASAQDVDEGAQHPEDAP